MTDHQHSSGRRFPRGLIAAQVILVAALAVWLLLVRRDIGWPGEWTWPVLGPVYPIGHLLAPALVVMGFSGLIAYLWSAMLREEIPGHRRALAWSIAGSLAIGAWCLQLALWSVAPLSVPRLATVQLSEVSTGYLGEAYRIDALGEYLDSYAREMGDKPEHVATHPPGAVLFFYAVRRVGQLLPGLNRLALTAGSTAVNLTIRELAAEVTKYPTAAWQGSDGLATAVLASWLLGACGALMPVALFWALRGPMGEGRALAAAAMVTLTPTMLLFFPLLDELIALLGTLMLAALVATQRHWAWAAAAGAIAAAALFVSLGALALVALGCVFLLLRAAKQAGQSGDSSWSDTRSVFVPVAAFLGGLAVGIGLWYAAGVDAIPIFSQGLSAHSSITGRASFRSYSIWVWLNLVEFAIFLGLPLAATVAASAGRFIRELRPMSGPMLPAYLGATALLTLLLLDVSGTVKGETGRLWMFFAPWLGASVAPRLCDEAGSRWRLLAIACGLTALQLLLMAWTMQPIIRPY
ncbi:MAG: hypothetical protein U9R79_12510 [Armatimonadota bacterium]|nr:hypothetical protein [Armatimonadota bacterium]